MSATRAMFAPATDSGFPRVRISAKVSPNSVRGRYPRISPSSFLIAIFAVDKDFCRATCPRPVSSLGKNPEPMSILGILPFFKSSTAFTNTCENTVWSETAATCASPLGVADSAGLRLNEDINPDHTPRLSISDNVVRY